MSIFDAILGFMQVVGSAMSERSHAPLYNVGDGADEDPEDAPGQEAFMGPGFVFRPLPPDDTGHCDSLVARTASDGLTPFAYRDLRINAKYPNPKEGEGAHVGYYGGYHAITPTTANSGSGKADIHTIYCPYDFNSSGVPQKAMALQLNPELEQISLIHGDGQALIMDSQGITARASGTTFANLQDGKITLMAAQIALTGNVALGANTAVALPLAPGSSSQPCPSLFLSPV